MAPRLPHIRHIRQLAVEGLAYTLVVLAGLVIVSTALHSSLAKRAEGLPILGEGVRDVRSVVDRVVTPAEGA